mgnify:CR=1 FL=1
MAAIFANANLIVIIIGLVITGLVIIGAASLRLPTAR